MYIDVLLSYALSPELEIDCTLRTHQEELLLSYHGGPSLHSVVLKMHALHTDNNSTTGDLALKWNFRRLYIHV